jgi:hypothetical protein
MMNIDDLHEQIMLFEELEAYFSGVHGAKPEDEARRKKLLQQVVQLKEKTNAEFKELKKKAA